MKRGKKTLGNLLVAPYLSFVFYSFFFVETNVKILLLLSYLLFTGYSTLDNKKVTLMTIFSIPHTVARPTSVMERMKSFSNFQEDPGKVFIVFIASGSQRWETLDHPIIL